MLNKQGKNCIRKIKELDARDDESELDKFDKEDRIILFAEQSWIFFKQEVVLYKKACLKWLKQGDLNSIFFSFDCQVEKSEKQD